MEEVVCPPGNHKYEYPGVPPPAVALAVPLHNPKQVTSVEVVERVRIGGSVMVTLLEARQPCASVIFKL